VEIKQILKLAEVKENSLVQSEEGLLLAEERFCVSFEIGRGKGK
jgi:hypothetical protein